jgi:type I restriction enzyme S subunit
MSRKKGMNKMKGLQDTQDNSLNRMEGFKDTQYKSPNKMKRLQDTQDNNPKIPKSVNPVKDNGRPGYKHTPLGWIPEDWEVKKLGELGKVVSGLTYDPTNISSDGVLVLRSSNIKNRRLAFTDNVYVNVANGDFNPVQSGDILICVRNGSRDLIGKNAIITEEANGLAFGAFMAVFRSEWNTFLHQLFDTDIYLKEIHKNLGATINSINGSDLRLFKIPFPPKEERKIIATILSTWDEAITKTQQLIAQLQKRNKGLMQQLLTGKKRLKGFEGEWNEVHLGDVFTERNETGYINLDLLSIGSLGVYPQSQSDKRDISNTDKSKYKRICPGDIGYNTMRMWQGRSALSSMEGIVSPAYTIVTPKHQQHSEFYGYLFKLPSVVNKFFRNSQGLVEDTLNCKFKDLAIVKVEVPQYNEQVAIAQVIQQGTDEVKLYEQKLAALQQQKKGLMQKLLTGEVRVKLSEQD